MRSRLTILVTVALAVGIIAPTAHASFVLTLETGPTQFTIPDGDIADVNPVIGAITFSGAVGTNWTVNVTTGLSKPVFGGPAAAKLDLNSVNVTTAGAGQITIRLTDTDFSLPAGAPATFTSSIGGTTTGTLTLTQILDRDNNEFASGSSDLVSLVSGPFGTGAFSSTLSAAAPVSGPFSLTEVVVITHPRAGITSFDAESVAESIVVPAPGAILLVVLGLGGVTGLKRRRFV